MPIMSLQDWIAGTDLHDWKKIRSWTLRSLDNALDSYHQRQKTRQCLNDLLEAFSKWAGVKEAKYWLRNIDSPKKFLSSRNIPLPGNPNMGIVDLLWQQIKAEFTAYPNVNTRDYEPSLYIRENIIGYTGDTNHFPTVYFSQPPVISLIPYDKLTTASRKLVRYGHITQCHSIDINVGRGIVKECCDYRITNVTEQGIMKLKEYTIGRSVPVSKRNQNDPEQSRNLFHPSRNAFMPVHGGVIARLETAIVTYRFLKNYDARGLGVQPQTNLVQDAKTKEWHFG